MTECIICFCEIGPEHDKVGCSNCGEEFHYTCYRDWARASGRRPLKCVHCQVTGTLSIRAAPRTPGRYLRWLLRVLGWCCCVPERATLSI